MIISGALILIPNLVSTVSGAANFEEVHHYRRSPQARASVGQVKIDANSAPTDAAQLAAFQKAQGQLGSALSRLLVVSERYPDLKAESEFPRPPGATGRNGESHHGFAHGFQQRRAGLRHGDPVFSNDVMHAGHFGFKAKPYFQAAAGSETAPKVQFDFGGAAAGTNK